MLHKQLHFIVKREMRRKMTLGWDNRGRFFFFLNTVCLQGVEPVTMELANTASQPYH